MRLISFTDYDGRTRHVVEARVVDVREPGGGVHDHGHVELDTGAVIAFYSEDECRRFVKQLREPIPEASGRQVFRQLNADLLEKT